MLERQRYSAPPNCRTILTRFLGKPCGQNARARGAFFYAWTMPKLRAAVLIIPILISGCEAPELQVTEVSGDITGLSQWAPERLLPANFYDLALEEASVVVGSYLATSDAITSEGGKSWQPISSLVSERWLSEEQEGFRYFEREGLRSIGETTFDSLIVQSAHITLDQQVEVGILACIDGTGVFVLPTDYDDPPEILWQWHPAYEDFEGDEGQWEQLEEYLSQPGVTWGEERAVQAWLVGEAVHSLVIDSWEQWWGVYEC